MSARETSLLHQQLDYYRAGTREYDELWLRRGRYDRGEVLNGQWFKEAALVSSALANFHPVGHLLEFGARLIFPPANTELNVKP